MDWIVASNKWIMLVSGGLTCTMFYAAIAPQAALRSTFGRRRQGTGEIERQPMRCVTMSILLLFWSDAALLADEQGERNKNLARRFYEQVWFSRNLAAVDDLFASTYVAHDIRDRKGVAEPASRQKEIADCFWRNGTMTGPHRLSDR